MNYLTEFVEELRLIINPEMLPDGNTRQLLRIYAVLGLSFGNTVKTEDVHNAWVAWMASQNPDHPSLVPFEILPRDVAAEDEPFVVAIRTVAERWKSKKIR